MKTYRLGSDDMCTYCGRFTWSTDFDYCTSCGAYLDGEEVFFPND